ncbi:MAG: hypothetical protein PHX80_04815 [Candidatus Nanoarchaeia archaeon]|nr:hypothetical protein [Candidatus Nanoarchaeia archaeon]
MDNNLLPSNLPDVLNALSELSKQLGYWKAILMLSILMSLIMLYLLARSYLRSKKEGSIKVVLSEFTQTASGLLASSNSHTILLNDIKLAIDKQFANNISIDQAEVIVSTVTRLSSLELYKMAEDIILNNNIEESKKEIEIRVYQSIEVQWNEDNSYLSKFRYKSIRLSEFLNEYWKTEIYESTLKNIFISTGSKDKKLKTVRRSIATQFSNIKLLAIEAINNYQS